MIPSVVHPLLPFENFPKGVGGGGGYAGGGGWGRGGDVSDGVLDPHMMISVVVIFFFRLPNYSDAIMSVMTSQTNSVSIVYSTVCSGVDQRKHPSSASLAFVRGIHQSPANSPHKGPVQWKMLPFDDVIIAVHHMVWYHKGPMDLYVLGVLTGDHDVSAAGMIQGGPL